MSIEPTQGAAHRWTVRLGLVLLVFAIISGIFAGLTTWLEVSWAQRMACVDAPKTLANFAQDVHACSLFEKVSADEAERAFDSYLIDFTFNKDRGWSDLSADAQNALPKDQYLQSLGLVVWQDRASILTSYDFNKFRFVLRRFEVNAKSDGTPNYQSPTGPVNEYHAVLTAQKADGRVTFALQVQGKTSKFGRRVSYAWANAVSNTRTWTLPSDDESKGSEVDASDVRAGRGFRVLCQLETDSGKVWDRTYRGWLLDSEAELTDPPSDGLIACFGRYPGL